jgi:hypothetical protein
MASADLLGIDTVLRIDGRLRLLTGVDVLFSATRIRADTASFSGLKDPRLRRSF